MINESLLLTIKDESLLLTVINAPTSNQYIILAFEVFLFYYLVGSSPNISAEMELTQHPASQRAAD